MSGFCLLCWFRILGNLLDWQYLQLSLFLEILIEVSHTANPPPRFITCIDSAELTEYSEIRPINS